MNTLRKSNILPSAFKPGDKVNLIFPTGSITNCEVYQVRFTGSKIHYDLVINIGTRQEEDFTSIENIDSCFVTSV